MDSGSEDTDCGVVERDFVAAWWLIAQANEYELHDANGLRWFHSGVAETYLNMVLLTRLGADEAAERVAGLVSELKDRGHPFLWWTFPSCRPSNLGEILSSHGLVRDEEWPGMALRIAALAPPPPVAELEIRRVTDAAAYDAYERIVSPILSPSPTFTAALRQASLRIGFAEDAPEVHFLGYVGGEPVATTSLLTSGGAAGIYNVATAEPHRGRGIAAQMTAHAIAVGGRRGLKVATLQSSTMGRRVYERLGFTLACELVPYRFAG